MNSSGGAEVTGVTSISKDNSDQADDRQIVGRKIWRIFPYVKKYWKSAVGGIAANAGARAFDLIPFIAIGMAADYYQSGTFTSERVERIMTSNLIPTLGPIDSEELGFGLLILYASHS